MPDAIELKLTDPGFDKVIADFDALPKKLQQTVLQGSAVGREYGRMKGQMAAAGKQAKDTNDGILDGLSSMVLTYASMAGAIGLATKALTLFNDQRERGAKVVEAQEFDISSLATIAKNPADFQRMINESKRTAAEAGITVAEGAKLQFTLESAGLADFRKEFASLKDLGQDPQAFADAVSKTMENFKGSNPREIMNELFAAAREANASPTEVAAGVTRSAKLVQQLGGTKEELVATIAVGSKSFPSVDEAATALRGFAVSAQKQGFAGQGLVESALNAQKIATEQGMSEGDLQKFLGSQEAVTGYLAIIANLQQIQQYQATTEAAGKGTGTADDQLAQMLQTAQSDPAQRAAKAKRVAITEADIAEGETFGTGELKQDAFRENLRGGAAIAWEESAVAGIPATIAAEVIGRLVDWLGIDHMTTGDPNGGIGIRTNSPFADLTQEQLMLLKQATENLNNASGKLEGAVKPPPPTGFKETS